jgi:hypothetical protein
MSSPASPQQLPSPAHLLRMAWQPIRSRPRSSTPGLLVLALLPPVRARAPARPRPAPVRPRGYVLWYRARPLPASGSRVRPCSSLLWLRPAATSSEPRPVAFLDLSWPARPVSVRTPPPLDPR